MAHISGFEGVRASKMEWAGKRYREATFTMIEAVTGHVVATTGGSSNGGAGGGAGGYDAPWGSSLMSGISKMMGGGGRRCRVTRRYGRIGPDSRGGNSPATLWLVVQPGNGGPVEDWVNCEKMSVARPDAPVVILNRGGFYRLRDSEWSSGNRSSGLLGIYLGESLGEEC